MSVFEIQGVDMLHGEVNIQGSKNSVLPILAATLLNKGISKICGCPQITDVYNMIEILKHIGCTVTWEGNDIIVDSREANNYNIPSEFVTKMRSSIVFLGPLLGRFHRAVITYPGGCLIGERPIDIHIDSFRKMNIVIEEIDNILYSNTDNIIGSTIALKKPSVGATQNIIMAAVLSQGKTCILNAAKEPEIVELAKFLTMQGADISGAGTTKIIIKGVEKLNDIEFMISGDRIVAGTYLAAVAGTGGYVTLTNINHQHLTYVIKLLRKMGCQIITDEYNTIIINKNPNSKIKKIRKLITKPYPGFPTDMQSQIMAVLTLARGKSKVREEIFESRFKIVSELNKMGADIKTNNSRATITGVRTLTGACVKAYELRGGAALVIAGLMAEGKTVVSGTEYIERGYEDIIGDFNKLGAQIEEYEVQEKEI